MLVLSRKPGERIILTHAQTGEQIVLTTVRIGPNTVRIGLDCDREWNIARDELVSSGWDDQTQEHATPAA